MKKLVFLWYYWRLQSSFADDFSKTKRLTLWYLAGKKRGFSDAIDYAFYKTYGLWGVDALSESEKKGF